MKNTHKYLIGFICSTLLSCGGGGDGPDNKEFIKTYTLPSKNTTWSAEQIKAEVLRKYSNIARWEAPIEVNTNGITRVNDALDRYEKLLGGVVFFTRVTKTPENGIEFIEGGAKNSDGTPGCGQAIGPQTTYPNTLEYNGLYYIYLGSSACNDAENGEKYGPYASAIAEHELGHALGLGQHFKGFEGEDGLIHPNFFNVMYNLYANPIGATDNEVSISIVEVGQFGE